MKIHALTTGAVRVRHSFRYPRQGRRRQLDLFLPRPFSDRHRSTAGRSSTAESCG